MNNMVKKEIVEKEKEPLTDIIDADTLKILNGKVKKLDDELSEKYNIELMEKADKQKEDISDLEADMRETSFYLNFFMSIAITLVNPILKKYNIDEITTEETQELTIALMGIASEKALGKTGKIAKSISKIVNLPKILKLVTIVWKIAFPRLNKYLESKPKKTKID